MKQVFAHSKTDCPCESWQTLEEHSARVAYMAGIYAKEFNSEGFGRFLGYLHDIGKARSSFQGYLMRQNGIDDKDYDYGDHSHSGAGACWGIYRGPFQKLEKIFAYILAGHHAGLPDWSGGETPAGALNIRLELEKSVIEEEPVSKWIADHSSEWIKSLPTQPPWQFDSKCKEGEFCKSDLSFWIRMLYSCLVDADFLDTEHFMDDKRSRDRKGYADLEILADRFFANLDAKQGSAPQTEVNALRAKIREACETAAMKTPGIFTLTVPTGGGKTLSSTAFAFRHSLRYGKKRIIYVIPYTSIIEQTSNTLRHFLGEGDVLEHHCNFDPKKETPRSQLASENWDAPVVVTTSVQFFESLYSGKSSRCRKLHNIANSVVILDEVQLLPSHLLLPIIEAIRQLTDHYGVTLLLSTATQPKFPGLDLSSDREIIPKELDLYAKLKRTQIEWPSDLRAVTQWEEVAEEISRFDQVLCVVNTRKDCRELYNLMPSGTIHLSAGMCGEHRTKVIDMIKSRLAKAEPVRVVSTQLVEAGVDFDFPVVYRAFTGLSSIAQAAGRCNREGSLPHLGKVVVFVPPKQSPAGELRKAEDTLREMLACHSPEIVNTPKGYGAYFKSLYGRMNHLGENFRTFFIENSLQYEFQFREGDKNFQMIDDQISVSITVRYGDNDTLIDQLRIVGPNRETMRALQRYTVSIPRSLIGELIEKGFIEEMYPGVFVQTIPSLYSENFGLDLYREGLQAEDLMT